MNLIGTKLNALQRSYKTLLVLLNDLFLSFICWLVFGPPMATMISNENPNALLELILLQKYSFIFPALFFISYLHFFGYYKSLIRFFDSRDSIFICVSGSLIFGFSWAGIYILQFDVIATNFLSVIILQGLLLSAVLYAFINISRDVAKYFLYPYEKDANASSVVIYGAGESAQALLNTLQNDSTKNVIAIFDDSSALKNLQINNIPIITFEQQDRVLKVLSEVSKEKKSLFSIIKDENINIIRTNENKFLILEDNCIKIFKYSLRYLT